ncbi:MAG: polyprenyl synthetase family protein [Thermoanaerobaculia bacterium]|nr:polyprenyl synthetase family protein [Thermoanaerobaculia bacterium]
MGDPVRSSAHATQPLEESEPGAAGEDLGAFLSWIRRGTRAAVERLLPLDAGRISSILLLPGESPARAALGPRLVAAVAQPARIIADRGGKFWRGFTIAAACEAVGAGFFPFADWLAFPELLHVGSLIIDDVEDGSALRRGGPACHMLVGIPLALSAGSATYFCVQKLIRDARETIQLPLYEEYVSLLRAAHVGQALDILGLDDEIAKVAAGEEAAHLVACVLETHRLKSGIPFRGCARIGGWLGGGTPAQVTAAGEYFAAFGLSFQVVDDVLNVEGFEGVTKERGEDLLHGKVTMPVALAMRRLGRRDRARFHELLKEARQDEAARELALSWIQDCGALEECRQLAASIMDSAWPALTQAVPVSQALARIQEFARQFSMRLS